MHRKLAFVNQNHLIFIPENIKNSRKNIPVTIQTAVSCVVKDRLLPSKRPPFAITYATDNLTKRRKPLINKAFAKPLDFCNFSLI